MNSLIYACKADNMTRKCKERQKCGSHSFSVTPHGQTKEAEHLQHITFPFSHFSHAPHFPHAPYTCFSHSSSSVSVLCDPILVPLFLIWVSLTAGPCSLPPSPSIPAHSLPVELPAPHSFLLTVQCPLIIISNNIKTKTPETSPIQRASTVLSWCVGEKGTLKYCIKGVCKPLPRAKVKVHAQRSELAAKVCYSEYFFF